MSKIKARFDTSTINGKKKIVIFSPVFNLNRLRGSERVNYYVAKLLALTGSEIIVLSSTLPSFRFFNNLINNDELPSNELVQNVKIIRLKTNRIINVIWYMASLLSRIIPIFERFPYGVYFNKINLIKTLKKIKPDIIYSSILPFYHNRIIISALKDLKRTKFILRTETHPYQKQYLLNINKEILNKAYYIQTSTDSEKKLLKTLFNIEESRIVTIPPLIDGILFNKNNILRLSNPLPDRKKIILFIGKKNTEKGSIILLKAVRKLWKTDNTYLLIAAGESSLKWEINKLVYGGPFLIDLGWISEVKKRELFSRCTVFCMPSTVESFGLVYVEAWKRKKPVIAIRSKISEEIIETNNAGALINKSNVGELMTVIKTVVNNKNLADKCGKNGYKFYKKEYDSKKIKSKYLNLFLK